MERLYHFQTLLLLIVMMLFLSCSITGCTTYKIDQTDNRQVMLEVPAELLQPIQPLILLEQPAKDKTETKK